MIREVTSWVRPNPSPKYSTYIISYLCNFPQIWEYYIISLILFNSFFLCLVSPGRDFCHLILNPSNPISKLKELSILSHSISHPITLKLTQLNLFHKTIFVQSDQNESPVISQIFSSSLFIPYLQTTPS